MKGPWRWLALLGLLGAGSAEASAAPVPTRGCEAIAADLGAARAGGRLADVTTLLAEAGRTEAGCEPKRLFCLGRSAALAHVEAAYAAADAGRAAEARRLFEAGRAFGAPWPLLVGLGDAADGAARADHDPAAWTKASLAYQQALAALGEPDLCPEEPVAPDAAAAAAVLRKMLLATLLARPVSFARDRCAPCALAFLAHGPIDATHPRALPVTFAEGRADLTPEGLATAKDLAACAVALRWPRLAMTVHADASGTAPLNLELSRRRAAALRRALRAGGFAGPVEAEAVGARQPLPIDDPTGLSPADIRRANRRVDLRGTGAPSAALCTPAPGRGP